MSTPAFEKKPVLLLILATLAILVGTIITMVLPFAWVNTETDRIETVTPYSAIEQAGRDIYIREGCNNCHTQTVRPLVADVLRYGEYSKSGEFVYDRPHLWGSRRTGPDLARLGGKYPDAWHYEHMRDPRSTTPGSVMPPYPWLLEDRIDPEDVRAAASGSYYAFVDHVFLLYLLNPRPTIFCNSSGKSRPAFLADSAKTYLILRLWVEPLFTFVFPLR